MPDRERTENRKFPVCALLVFNGAADGHVFIAVCPIVRDALRKALDALDQKQKCAVLPLPDHLPAVGAPGVCLFDQKIG